MGEEKCPNCNGLGAIDLCVYCTDKTGLDDIDCPRCKGTGKVEKW